MLHNVILSLAANYSESRYLEAVDWGGPFAARAKQLIDSESERPMLSTVAALALLGSHHSGTAQHGLGYMYAGMGFRMSYTRKRELASKFLPCADDLHCSWTRYRLHEVDAKTADV